MASSGMVSRELSKSRIGFVDVAVAETNPVKYPRSPVRAKSPDDQAHRRGGGSDSPT